MKVVVRVTKTFQKAAKPLLKKYPSLVNDLLQLEAQLVINPKLGTPLGQDCFKIRLQISSKAKGKAAGARVISLVESVIVGQVYTSNEETYVNLITIYDKSDTAAISDRELKALIKTFRQE